MKISKIKRKKTRQIAVGKVKIGAATVAQIVRLQEAGCEIVRVAVPDPEAAAAISAIKRQIDIPLIADIHFNYRLALIADIHFNYRLAIAAAKAGADGLRLNPGNIGGIKKVKAVVDCAKDFNLPIRIGVNSGSLEKDILKKYNGVTAAGMVESGLRHVELLKSLDFHQIKISLKASDVPRTLEAYRLLSSKTDLPLHVGVTEAGALYSGIVKSALGIGMLLAEGIGDTIRVSLTRDPVEEVRVGFEILKALDIRRRGPEIIACPTCGRCNIELFDIVERVEKALMTTAEPLKIAIMGCVVNGPGEAREVDIGIAGGDGSGVLFRKGKVVKKFAQEKLVDVLLHEVREYVKDLNTENRDT
jgi:(E)-4-hydroxy-3-methylbut-2-enyl-diphosphate synthase